MNVCVSIAGAARVGKSTLAEAMSEEAVDGSVVLAEYVYRAWRWLQDGGSIYGIAGREYAPLMSAFRAAHYTDDKDCHADRRSHRSVWHRLSLRYQGNDAGRLIVDTLDLQTSRLRVHTGARRQVEIDAARRTIERRGDVFVVVLVIAPERAGTEPVNDVVRADITLHNDASLAAWRRQGAHLASVLENL